MKRFILGFLILSAILISVSWAQTPGGSDKPGAPMSFPGPTPGMKLYDDFNARYINPLKWSGENVWGISEYVSSFYTLESIRELQSGKLRLGVRTYGARDSDSGSQIGNYGLNFANPNAITSISTRIVVTSGQRAACTANPWGEYQAVLTGSFFNTGTGQKEEDVWPYLLVIGPDETNQVFAGAAYSVPSLGWFEWNYLGPFNIGEEVTVSMRWDQPNHRFVAGLKRAGAQATIAYLPYSFADTMPPANPFKRIDVRAFAANCVGEKTVTGMTALFDDVMVNGSQLP